MLGIDLATAGFLSAAAIAALAGLLSFLSPCVLPIVPPYLAYMTGVNVSGLRARQRRQRREGVCGEGFEVPRRRLGDRRERVEAARARVRRHGGGHGAAHQHGHEAR